MKFRFTAEQFCCYKNHENCDHDFGAYNDCNGEWMATRANALLDAHLTTLCPINVRRLWDAGGFEGVTGGNAHPFNALLFDLSPIGEEDK